MGKTIEINGRQIGPGNPTYIIAELSANHNQDISEAIALIHEAKDAGADAIKLQTYTPDTMTINSDKPPFQIKGGLWGGKTLYELYGEAYTPWEWHPELKAVTDDLEIDLFSTPFDHTAVDYLEKMDIPVFKIASFEVVDLPLVRRIAQTGKPIIMSTGMASLSEIDEAVKTIRSEGNEQFMLLHCISSYPAPPEEMNLLTMPHLSAAFGVPAGLSDHSEGIAAAIGSVALGACAIEKHFIRDRKMGGPDSPFSIETTELEQLVRNVRTLEKALGKVDYELTERESESLVFRRSLFVVADIKKGEQFTSANVRSIRPGIALPPKYIDDILGRKATQDISRGTPLNWSLVGS